MAPSTLDTDAIVREVVRRLTAMLDSAVPPATQRVAAEAQPGELPVAERVVTLASLEGRLANVRRIVIGRKAIVSPAARDELRARGIEVARGEPRTSIHARPILLAADTEGPVCLKEWERTVGAGATRCTEHTREAIVARLGPWIESGGVAVWWTEQPARTVCDANRDPRVRACLAHDATAVDEALGMAQANVLVFDVRRRQAQLWKNWLGRLRSS